VGDPAQVAWVRRMRDQWGLTGPVLELGSRRYDDTPTFHDYRPEFPGQLFVGTDLSDGVGVDVAVDFCLPLVPFQLRKRVGGQKFRTVLALSVLEHVRDLPAFITNMRLVADVGAAFLLSTPLFFPVHGYPEDYWRFTSAGVQVLFPEIDFELPCCQTHCDDTTAALDSVPHGENALFHHGSRMVCLEMFGFLYGKRPA
jgi:hypothetical protein